MCGGTLTNYRPFYALDGLSPRVRGNRRFRAFRAKGQRSIPACAGEPDRRHSGATRSRVYPRVCGGTRAVDGAMSSGVGLSPRVRGNPGRIFPADDLERSIPACAGEPMAATSTSVCRWVYPRVCGGTGDMQLPIALPAGLSPRVRGNPLSTALLRSIEGSIPACAGEPRSAWTAGWR